MRAVTTFLSISFLLLATSLSAFDEERFKDLPNEIKNLKQEKILNSIVVRYTSELEESHNTAPIMASVIVKLKLKRNGSVDTAVVVYSENPSFGFDKLALQTVLESTFETKSMKRRRVNPSWFYTEVIFARMGSTFPANTDSLSSKEEDTSPSDTDFVPFEIMPEIIFKGRPEYPRRARQAGKEAVVMLRVLVGEKGNVLDVKVMGSPSQLKALDEYGFIDATVSGARKCRFKPAYQDGKPVKVWVSFPYEFILHPKR